MPDFTPIHIDLLIDVALIKINAKSRSIRENRDWSICVRGAKIGGIKTFYPVDIGVEPEVTSFFDEELMPALSHYFSSAARQAAYPPATDITF